MKKNEDYTPVSIATLLQSLVKHDKVEVLSGLAGLNNMIRIPRVQKPGLTLTGLLESSIRSDRVQVLGNSEISFIKSLDKKERTKVIRNFCGFSPCCIIVSKKLAVPEELLTETEKCKVPVLRSALTTGTLIEQISRILSSDMAPETTVHGVFMEIFGLGVLIIGDPGIGKSESALDLITRGHRFIADDAVRVKKYAPDVLVGTSYDLIRNLMEIRGLGIINIRDLFGMGSVRGHKRVELIIFLEKWEEGKTYDRLGLIEELYEIMDTSISMHKIPVAPGRNLAVIIETAARNHLVKRNYGRSSEAFEKKMNKAIQEKQSRKDKSKRSGTKK